MLKKKNMYLLSLVLVLGVGFPGMVFGEGLVLNGGKIEEGFNNNVRIAELEMNVASADSANGVEGGQVVDLVVERRKKKNRREDRRKSAKRIYRKLPEDAVAPKISKKKKKRKHRHHRRNKSHIAGKHHTAPDMAKIREEYYIGIPLEKLNSQQQNSLRRKLEKLLTKKAVIAFLNSIQWAEGGQPTLPVGGVTNNGLGAKSQGCVEQINNLDLSGHPKEQHLPNACFYYNKNVKKWSFAAGNLQINFTNWKEFKNLFKFENFSERNQAIAGLELVRTSATPGHQIGDGLIALISNDLPGAVIKGSDPWASSPESRHKGAKRYDLVRHASLELRKLEQNNGYASQQLERFSREVNS